MTHEPSGPYGRQQDETYIRPDFSSAAYYQPQTYRQPAKVHDGLAITSMILGICWVGWIGSIVAVVFGHISIHNARQEHRPISGMAVTGLVLGYLGMATLAAVILVGVIGAATGSGS